MTDFKIGQRWISGTEPELGLGIIQSVERHRVQILFPASNEVRLYASANAPLKRVEFCPGDPIYSKTGKTLTVEAVKVESGIITYLGAGIEVPEMDLADTISFSKPEGRLIQGHVDSCSSFNLRYEAISKLAHAQQSNVAGFLGGRIDLIPHQLYIASEVSNRYMPRVLLADEVGLGKTIEACLILHRLHLTGRADRVLIILPESLVHQWFVELIRRFNLLFTLVDANWCRSTTEMYPDSNPFDREQRVICSIGTLVNNRDWAECALNTNWDMLVVDEAHHLEWMPEAVSPEYRLVERLTQRSQAVLLLTATPEQMGTEGHFARLRLLDPERYPDLDKFRKEQASYAKVVTVANKLVEGKKLNLEEIQYLSGTFKDLGESAFQAALKNRSNLLKELLDRHGTGRVIFRNSRDSLRGFPNRRGLPYSLHPHAKLSKSALEARLLHEFEMEMKQVETGKGYNFSHEPRILWLAQLLRDLGENEKILLICCSREKVLALYEALLEEINVKAALFHEELSLIQRDRNAAWFAEPDGAGILLCSEIGSEGRNFQFAHHLVLFDLPLNPELLEQRIGRIDRIGQTKTIQIHLPCLKHSWTELLMRFHHEGLNGVEHSLKGGYAYLKQFGGWIRKIGAQYHLATPEVLSGADALIDRSAEFRKNLETRLKQGQDRLISLNSFREETASELVGHIRTLDANRMLDHFMNRIFDHFGVTVEEIGTRTLYLKPAQMLTDSFPCLPEEGISVTYDRSRALGREDLSFLTWDHPMVRGAIDLILSSEKGNSCLVLWKSPSIQVPLILIEAIYVLESVAPARLHIERFLPPTPVRILVDRSGNDQSEKFSHEYINRHCKDEEPFRLKQDTQVLQVLVPDMLRLAKKHAQVQKTDLLQSAIRHAHEHLDGEAIRLKELKKVNPNVREEEIRIAEKVIADVTQNITKAHLRLDAVRLILS